MKILFGNNIDPQKNRINRRPLTLDVIFQYLKIKYSTGTTEVAIQTWHSFISIYEIFRERSIFTVTHFLELTPVLSAWPRASLNSFLHPGVGMIQDLSDYRLPLVTRILLSGWLPVTTGYHNFGFRSSGLTSSSYRLPSITSLPHLSR